MAHGGAVEVRVLTPNETGVASLLVTAEGGRYYLTTANEAPRLHDEEFGALDFEPVIFPWYADDTAIRRWNLARDQVACDTYIPGFCALYPLRASLQETEIERFRWLGAQTADAATTVVLQQLSRADGVRDGRPGGCGAVSRGILPSVYLMATDERIYKYKHAVARGKTLEKYAMFNLCARKWG
jgi:Xaa-Pro dipeptidase